jgi:hypothetical protein
MYLRNLSIYLSIVVFLVFNVACKKNNTDLDSHPEGVVYDDDTLETDPSNGEPLSYNKQTTSTEGVQVVGNNLVYFSTFAYFGSVMSTLINRDDESELDQWEDKLGFYSLRRFNNDEQDDPAVDDVSEHEESSESDQSEPGPPLRPFVHRCVQVHHGQQADKGEDKVGLGAEETEYQKRHQQYDHPDALGQQERRSMV